MLIGYPEHYRELVERRRAEGYSEELGADARDVGEQIATIMQSARGRQDLLAAVQSTPLNPAGALTALDQLFLSYVLLSAADDEFAPAALEPDELDGLLDSLDVPASLDALGAGGD